MNATTPNAVQISCWRAPVVGGELIRSIRWIMINPRPFSRITQGKITGSAYGSRHRTATWARIASPTHTPARVPKTGEKPPVTLKSTMA